MKRFAKLISFTIFFAVIFIFPVKQTLADSLGANNAACAIYFTGIGCLHCATADPVLFKQITQPGSALVVIEYEVFKNTTNVSIFSAYAKSYSLNSGVPQLVIDGENPFLGETEIINNKDLLFSMENKECLLEDGTEKNFADLDIANLPGVAKIWANGRVLIANDNLVEADSSKLRELLTVADPSSLFSSADYKAAIAEPVEISQATISFSHALTYNGWTLEWGMSGVSNKSNNTKGFLVIAAVAAIMVLALQFIATRRRPTKKHE